MNFTREPILETIISAKEGYKLKLKSTKNDGAQVYLVDAVEVVSFGTTFFYRSAEPAHTFFVPSQDFEIVQERQARLMLKTPTEKSIKIAGGGDGTKKNSSEKGDKKKSRSKNKPTQKKAAEPKVEDTEGNEKAPAVSTKQPVKGRTTKRPAEKKTTRSTSTKIKDQAASSDKPQPSMFSHLLRPPEALISDNIHKYQSMINSKVDEKKEKALDLIKETVEDTVKAPKAEVSTDNPIDDPNLTSEAPKPFEKLSEEPNQEEKPLSLKEKMKKVLSPAVKDPGPADED